MVLAPTVLEVWLGEEFREGGLAMAILMSYWLVNGTTGVIGPMLIACGRAPALARYAWLVAVSNLALSLALTPLLGLEGVTIGTAVPYLVGFPFLLRMSAARGAGSRAPRSGARRSDPPTLSGVALAAGLGRCGGGAARDARAAAGSHRRRARRLLGRVLSAVHAPGRASRKLVGGTCRPAHGDLTLRRPRSYDQVGDPSSAPGRTPSASSAAARVASAGALPRPPGGRRVRCVGARGSAPEPSNGQGSATPVTSRNTVGTPARSPRASRSTSSRCKPCRAQRVGQRRAGVDRDTQPVGVEAGVAHAVERVWAQYDGARKAGGGQSGERLLGVPARAAHVEGERARAGRLQQHQRRATRTAAGPAPRRTRVARDRDLAARGAPQALGVALAPHRDALGLDAVGVRDELAVEPPKVAVEAVLDGTRLAAEVAGRRRERARVRRGVRGHDGGPHAAPGRGPERLPAREGVAAELAEQLDRAALGERRDRIQLAARHGDAPASASCSAARERRSRARPGVPDEASAAHAGEQLAGREAAAAAPGRAPAPRPRAGSADHRPVRWRKGWISTLPRGRPGRPTASRSGARRPRRTERENPIG